MISPSRYQLSRRTGRRRGLWLESLEERRLLAVLTVDTDLDQPIQASRLEAARCRKTAPAFVHNHSFCN